MSIANAPDRGDSTADLSEGEEEVWTPDELQAGRRGDSDEQDERNESGTLYSDDGDDPLEMLEELESGRTSLRTVRRQSERVRERQEAAERWARDQARTEGGLGDGQPAKPEQIEQAREAAPRDDPAQKAAWRSQLDRSVAYWSKRAVAARRSPIRRESRTVASRRRPRQRRAAATPSSSGGGDPPEGDEPTEPGPAGPPTKTPEAGGYEVAARARGTLGAAVWYLRGALANGARPVADVMAEGLAAGHSERTLRRARKLLRVKTDRCGPWGPGGAWVISFPVEVHRRGVALDLQLEVVAP